MFGRGPLLAKRAFCKQGITLLNQKTPLNLSGTGDSQRDSIANDSIRANHSQLKPHILIALQADSPALTFGFPIRANHPTHANRANRFARITPLSESDLDGSI